MTWLGILKVAAELAIDLIRGKLEPKRPPANAPGLRFIDVEIQAKASRNAGHENAKR